MKIERILQFLLLLFFMVQLYGQTAPLKISDDLEISQLTDNCFLHVSYYDLENAAHFPANGMVFVDHGEAIILDTPWRDEETNLLIEWIQNELDVKIIGCVVNHWHIDCMGGLKAIHRAGIASYAHEKTRQIASEKQLPLPEHVFKDSLIIPVGQKQLVCKYLGAAHTLDNIVVWQPDDKVLFAGCMVKALNWRTLGNMRDGDHEDYPITLKRVLNEFPDCNIVIPGHGRVGDRSLITHTISLCDN